jgi:hypothetical protein
MLLPLLLALLQTTAPPVEADHGLPVSRDVKPVRVWLSSTGPLARGQSVPVYVQAAQDGALIVLHRRTDGRIEVLFPANPASNPFVHKGTYEIRGAADRPAWVVAEPDGTGMILAALSSDPLRVEEFVRAAAWNPDALAPTWAGSDAAGALSDIVQRMLGDGYFNYDFVTYTVAPPVYAQQPEAAPFPAEQQQDTAPNSGPYPVCLNCTFIGYEEIIIAPSHFGHRRLQQRDEGICGIHEPCAEANKTHAIALALRPAAHASVLPTRSEVVMPRRRSPPNAGDPIKPRQRSPTTGGVAAVPAPTGPRTLASAPLRHVRYTSLSAPETERPRGMAELSGGGGGGGGGNAPVVAIQRDAATGGHGGVSGQAMVRSGLAPRTAVAQRGSGGGGGGARAAGTGTTASPPAPRTRSAAVATGQGSAGPAQGIALPGNVERGFGSRGGGSTQFGVRRR